jgi:uncharacterized protein DUF3500
MKRWIRSALYLLATSLAGPGLLPADTTTPPGQRVTEAARAFLGALNEDQRRAVVYAFDDENQRVRWSNLPVGMVPRGGLSLEQMTAAQRAAAMTLLSTVLSRQGFAKIQQIVQGDEVLRLNRRSGGPRFGKELYYLSLLGTPSDETPWMLQFGGHHLALNITLAGERGVLTPTLTGAQPAMYTFAGTTVRPLKGESDKAIALLNALDATQKKRAILDYRVANLVLGPGEDGKTIQPEGLKASAMSPQQRAMLIDLIAEWAGIVHENAAAPRLEDIKASLDDTWFAWSGSTSVEPGNNITAYYRIQGPKLVIEYAPQPGDPTMHVHTMYRDPTNDYGRRPVSR